MLQATGAALGSAALADEDSDFDPPLKSVAYQPLPVNWKLGADTCLAKVSLPQAGQASTLAALILRITSSLCPQLLH